MALLSADLSHQFFGVVFSALLICCLSMSDGIPVLPVDDVVAGPANKRCRLRSKQTCEVIARPALPPAPAGHCVVCWWKWPAELWNRYSHRQKYCCIWFQFKQWREVVHLDSLSGSQHCSKELLRLSFQDFENLSKKMKNSVLRHFLEVTSAPIHVLLFSQTQWPLIQAPSLFKMAHQQMLLTWQGEFGVLGKLSEDHMKLSTQDFTEYVRRIPAVQQLKKEFEDFVQVLVCQCHVPFWAFSLEICLKTQQETGNLRLHCHAFLRREDEFIRISSLRKVHFKDCCPHVSTKCFGKQLTRRCWSGMYYVMCPKKGSVYSRCSHEAGDHYPVNPEWITRSLEANKMDHEDARSEYIKCFRGARMKVGDLDFCIKAQKDLQLQKRVHYVQVELQKKLVDFPRWPVVDGWLSEVCQPLQHRKKFLSWMGRLDWVRLHMCVVCFL